MLGFLEHFPLTQMNCPFPLDVVSPYGPPDISLLSYDSHNHYNCKSFDRHNYQICAVFRAESNNSHFEMPCPKPVPFFAQRTLFGYIFAVNLRIFWCTFTGLNNVVVSQNWQISFMVVGFIKRAALVFRSRALDSADHWHAPAQEHWCTLLPAPV